MTDETTRGEHYEQANVHDVYNKIASHFSSTRFKPWPVIDEFLRGLPAGSIGLDIGCGNGKYLTVNKDIYIVASDRSTELIKFAEQHQPHSAIVGDILSLPHPPGKFDFAISIAVIHHLSTPERRVESVRTILQTLKPSVANKPAGEALFFVWALEQKNSRRGWDEGDNQDQLVPWVLKPDKNREAQDKPTTHHRYYHLYKQGELEEDVRAAGGEVVRSGYDRDNWWCVARRA
ncbi:tRNA methyltransferase, has a role in tRNA modification [Knufia fluminis]|uniref:tRNA methyltransferase, has a role in tRNA modification n=1 Tax=Knufia fluminis TaxID=191047 RepID=A0AAN8I329_9EURO|nr:tRNA methyltransferase, has a role in tRNA modification [Knufia fluminis]